MSRNAMRSPSPTLDEVLDFLRAFVAARYGPTIQPVSVRIDLGPAVSPWRCSFPPPLAAPPPRAKAPAAELPSLNGTGHAEVRDIEAEILHVATKEPQPAKSLARKAGYRYGGYFRTAIANLVRTRRLVRNVDGLHLPGD